MVGSGLMEKTRIRDILSEIGKGEGRRHIWNHSNGTARHGVCLPAIPSNKSHLLEAGVQKHYPGVRDQLSYKYEVALCGLESLASGDY